MNDPRESVDGVGTPSAIARVLVSIERHSMLFVVVVIMAVGLLVAIIANASGPDEPDYGDEYGAVDVCHQAVKDLLKAPSTAKFSDDVAVPSGTGWTVTGSVDSQNSFGAMIRGAYSCDATYDGDDSWLTRNVRIE